LISPSNNHEREIVRIVDQITLQGGMSRATALTFAMSRSDSKFLMEYVRWRMDHPILKPSESSLPAPLADAGSLDRSVLGWLTGMPLRRACRRGGAGASVKGADRTQSPQFS